MNRLKKLGLRGIATLKSLGKKRVIFYVVLLTIVVKSALFINAQFFSPSFTEIFIKAGLKNYWNGGFVGNAAGITWVDFNNDNLLDLFVGGRQIKLYLNKGNGTFVEVTKQSKLPNHLHISGVFGDFDNDGCKDVFLVAHVIGTDSLHRNNCDGTFSNVTVEAGFKQEALHGYGAAWADYNNDGYLDLYVVNYGKIISPTIYQSEPNFLYRNNGDGTFTDVTKISNASGATNCGLKDRWAINHKVIDGPYKESYQPAWLDYNNDGFIDLFIATDSGVSPLYKNNGDGTFTETTEQSGLCRLGTGMGVAVGDYDGNGYLDIYVTNTGANFLWHNNGNETFTEKASELGVGDALSIGWGTHFFDYDNDGDLDLYVTNGTVFGQESLWDSSVGKLKKDKLYKNEGTRGFVNIASQANVADDYSKEGAAFGDFDNDGFTDIYVSSNRYKTEKDRLYKNINNKNNWITIKLQGVKSNRDGIGARIIVKTGNKTQLREVQAGSSFVSQNSILQSFGLGNASIVDEIEIKWPSGIKNKLKKVSPNQMLTIVEM